MKPMNLVLPLTCSLFRNAWAATPTWRRALVVGLVAALTWPVGYVLWALYFMVAKTAASPRMLVEQPALWATVGVAAGLVVAAAGLLQRSRYWLAVGALLGACAAGCYAAVIAWASLIIMAVGTSL